MREKDDLKFYRKLMKHEVSVDRNKTAPRCKNCCYYHPDFKYRRYRKKGRVDFWRSGSYVIFSQLRGKRI